MWKFLYLVIVTNLFNPLMTCGEIMSNCKTMSVAQVVYGWKTIDFAFKSLDHRKKMIAQNKYIPNHVGIAGVKVGGDRMFISIGRFLPGIPATLTQVPYNFFEISTFKQDEPNGPLLTPFPNWEMQEIGNCSAFQTVQSMEIDQFNRLWVIDVGKSDLITPNMLKSCPAKIVVFDLNDNDKIVGWHEFPDDVIPYQSGAILEITVGCTSRQDCWAYMGDIFNSSIVIYNLRENKSWTSQHPSMGPEDGKYTAFGKPFNWLLGVDGMALSPLSQNFDKLYYTSLAGHTVYSIPTSILQKLPSSGAKAVNKATFTLPDSAITKVGKRQSLTDGFAMDANGKLYFGSNENNSIVWWDSMGKNRMEFQQELLSRNNDDLVWSDTLAFDQRGYLIATTTKFHQAPQYDRNIVNFRVIRIFVGAQGHSYLPYMRGKTI